MFEAHTAVIRQFLAGYSACLLCISYGSAIGWISPIQTFLESDESPVGKLTEYQIAWIASIPYLGALIGIFVFAPISANIGRKTMAYVLAIIYLLAALFINFTNSFILMLAARFAIGICIPGTLSTVSLYISETSDPGIRGNVGSGVIVFCNLGVIVMFFAYAVLSYQAYNSILIMQPLFFMAVFYIMPESPVYYLKKNQLEACRKSLQWLKATKNEETLNSEVEKLRAMFFDQESGQDFRPSLTWREVFHTKYYRKAFLLGIVLQSSICCSGIMVFQTFSYTIVSHCLYGNPPGNYPLYVFLFSTVAGIFSLFIMHRYSRNFIVFGTRLGTAASLFLLGILLVLKDVYNVYIPPNYFIVLIALYYLFLGLGLMSIVFVVMGELFSVECRDKFMQPLLLLHFGLFTLYLMMYPITVIRIQIYSWVFIFAVVTLLLTLILMVFLPETSGKTVSEIAQELTVDKKKISKKEVDQPVNNAIEMVRSKFIFLSSSEKSRYSKRRPLKPYQ